MKTLAAVLIETGKPLELMQLDLPPLKKGQALVKLSYSGICQSQLNEMRGYKGEDRFLPHTLGHEGSGTVLEVGEGVEKVAPGDSVVLTWIKGKGLEYHGTQYLSGKIKVNSGPVSSFLEYAVI